MKSLRSNLNKVAQILNVGLLCALCTGIASCPRDPQLNLPKGEDCTNSIEVKGKLLCVNTLLDESDPNYQYDRMLGEDRSGRRQEDKCTNIDDFTRIQNDFIDTKKKYLLCKKYPSKCQ